MKLSVVIPADNEIGTIREILSRVNAVLREKEIVVVDDRSTDGTWEAGKKIDWKDGVRAIFCILKYNLLR